jgi:anti-sigma factor RsiW
MTMIVTRDLVKDLLPLYVAGEASAESRAAVESFLSTDRDLAAFAASLREDAPVLVPVAGRGPLTVDRQALERTRRLLRRRTWLLAAAVLCTAMPWTFAFDSEGVRFLLVRDAPATGVMLLAAAVLFWSMYAYTWRRMRVTGL